jgi:ParB/Sulfiredoxin domain
MSAGDFETRRQVAKGNPLSQLNSRRRIESVDLTKLRPVPRNARQHSKKQVRQIAESIKRFGFNNPLIVDDNWNIVAGHGRFEAAKLLNMRSVPVITLSHLSEPELRAYRLADNKLAEKASWDQKLLVPELQELEVLLPELGLDLTATGFEPLELEKLTVCSGQGGNPPEKGQARKRDGASIHRARRPQAFPPVLGNQRADMVFGEEQIGAQNRAKDDCAEASPSVVPVVAENRLGLCAHHRADAVVNRIPGLYEGELVTGVAVTYQEQKNLFAWIKNNPARGTVYELVSVYRHPLAWDRNPRGACRGTKSRRGAAKGER